MMRYDVHAANRAAMLALAKSLGWPRVILKRRTTGNSPDSVGAGVTGWYLLAEQCGDQAIADATAALSSPTAASPLWTMPPAPAELELMEVES